MTESPTSRTSTSSVRGPHRSRRTRCACASAVWAGHEELAGRPVGRQLHHQIQKGLLAGGTADRIGLVDRRDADHVGEAGHTVSQVLPAVAQVRPEAEERPLGHGRVIRTAAEAMSTGTGGRSLRRVTVTDRARGPAEVEDLGGDALGQVLQQIGVGPADRGWPPPR